jgi:Mannosyl-glycoprotein endo-beta-N-acetylglucosaminidase
MLRFCRVVLLCVLLMVIGFSLLPDLRGRAAAPAPAILSSSVLGRPSLSASFVNQVLSAYHSPAAGTGQALYDLSLRYGIADEYALAFFLHESAFGTTGVARVTRSLGNIRCSDGYRCIAGYRAYSTWSASYDDWYQLIKYGYLTGQVSGKCPCVTVQQIIPVYAPGSDHNDERAYMTAVLSAVAAWRAGHVVV